METPPDHFLPPFCPIPFLFSLSFFLVCVPFFSFPFRFVSLPFASLALFLACLPAFALHCNSAEVGSGPASRQVGAALLLASIDWSDRGLAFAWAFQHRQAGRARCR